MAMEEVAKRLVTKAEFARMMGVDRRTPGKWAKAGRITLIDGRIDPDAARAQLDATGSPEPHHQARVEQIESDKAEKTAASTPAAGETGEAPSASDVGLQLKMARARYEQTRAEIEAMKRDEMAGLLIRRSDAEFVMDDMGRRLGNLLDRLADQITPKIISLRSDSAAVHAALVEAGRDLRVELAHYMQQAMEQK